MQQIPVAEPFPGLLSLASHGFRDTVTADSVVPPASL
jgi:hypothetical protein